jgi:hypothetical protein
MPSEPKNREERSFVVMPREPRPEPPTVKHIFIQMQPRGRYGAPVELRLSMQGPVAPARGFESQRELGGRSYLHVDGAVFEVLDGGARIARIAEPSAELRRLLGLL